MWNCTVAESRVRLSVATRAVSLLTAGVPAPVLPVPAVPNPTPKPKTQNQKQKPLHCTALRCTRHASSQELLPKKGTGHGRAPESGKKVPRKKPRVHDVVFVSTLSWHSLPVALVTRHAVGLWVAALIAWTGKRGQVSRKRRLQPPNGCPKT